MAHSINRPHCLKLLELYRRSTGCKVGMREPKFVAALFTVLTRYEALGGAGMQAALNGGVFEVLKCRFGVTSECFASPFNCRRAPLPLSPLVDSVTHPFYSRAQPAM